MAKTNKLGKKERMGKNKKKIRKRTKKSVTQRFLSHKERRGREGRESARDRR
jgi:hypothetical protein